MGPQLDSCGRDPKLYKECMQDLLQWGRNLIVAEGPPILVYHPADQTLQWGRNLIVAEGIEPNDSRLGMILASMGPQLDSCGRRVPGPVPRGVSTLQWGRNLIVAEGYKRANNQRT